MKKILVAIVVLFGIIVFAFGQIDRCPVFKAYNLCISDSRKVTNPKAVDGMAVMASIIESNDPGMGTLVLALVLADDIKPINRRGFGGIIDGASLILNKFDVLQDSSEKCNINQSSVTVMIQEIESAIRWEHSKWLVGFLRNPKKA